MSIRIGPSRGGPAARRASDRLRRRRSPIAVEKSPKGRARQSPPDRMAALHFVPVRRALERVRRYCQNLSGSIKSRIAVDRVRCGCRPTSCGQDTQRKGACGLVRAGPPNGRQIQMSKTIGCSAAAVAVVAMAMPSLALANDELLIMQQNPAEWVMPTGDYANQRYSTLAQINKDNVGDSAACLDLLDRRAARSRGRAAGDRRRDVHQHAVPQHRLRARPQRRGPGDLEVRAEAGSGRDPGDVLRYRQSRRRLRQRQDLPVSGRYHARGARCRHRRGRLAGQERRSEHRRDRHQRAHGLQEPGVRRHLRRRVRRSRQPDRVRHRDGRNGVARLLDWPRQRDADGPGADYPSRRAGGHRTAG